MSIYKNTNLNQVKKHCGLLRFENDRVIGDAGITHHSSLLFSAKATLTNSCTSVESTSSLLLGYYLDMDDPGASPSGGDHR